MRRPAKMPFDLRLAHFICKKGDDRPLFEFAEDIDRDDIPGVSIYLSGRFAIVPLDGGAATYRKTGDTSLDFGGVAAGKYVITALEDNSQSICLFPRRGDPIFQKQAVKLAAGSMTVVPKGKAFLLAIGTAEVGGSDRQPVWYVHAQSAEVEMHAVTDIVGLLFWR